MHCNYTTVLSLWQDWCPPLLRCNLGAWLTVNGETDAHKSWIEDTWFASSRFWHYLRYFNAFSFFWIYIQASQYVNLPLFHSRPIVCCAGASFCLSFLQPCFFSPLPSHFLAFHSHVLFLFFLHIPSPTSNIILVLPCFLSLASWWPLPCDLFAPVATCALWLPLADVAHHRAKHALNKPSNLKTPQGTILSAPYLASPLCLSSGCQLPSFVAKTSPALLHHHAVINHHLAATASECLVILKWKGLVC